MIEPYFFDREALQAAAARHAERYRTNDPFPHIVLDDFLPEHVLDRVLEEFPEPGDIDWKAYDTDREKKLATADETVLGPFTRHLLSQFNSSTFVDFLEALTGVEGLIPDPWFYGGGLHQIERGGHLKVHADFNWHRRMLLDRRLNVLVYLNRDWHEEFGGHLELWDRAMRQARHRILPVFNRCVIFNTTDFAYHGHPDPLTCPDARTRRSMALYYYSNGRPADEVSPDRRTEFKPRPGEVFRAGIGDAGRTQRALVRVTPPVLLDWGRSARRRLIEWRSAEPRS